MPSELQCHLRAHRNARRLTLEAVAEKIGDRFNTLSQWETMKRAVDLDDLAKLAAVYGVHPCALLMAPDEGPGFDARRKASELAGRMEPEAVQDWLRVGERMTPESRED